MPRLAKNQVRWLAGSEPVPPQDVRAAQEAQQRVHRTRSRLGQKARRTRARVQATAGRRSKASRRTRAAQAPGALGATDRPSSNGRSVKLTLPRGLTLGNSGHGGELWPYRRI